MFLRSKKNFFYKKSIMQLFSANAIVFSKIFFEFFLSPKTWKNSPQKLLIIVPDPFISQSSPDHSPKSRIDFSYYEISGPDICSLSCGSQSSFNAWIDPNVISLPNRHKNQESPSNATTKPKSLSSRIKWVLAMYYHFWFCFHDFFQVRLSWWKTLGSGRLWSF